MKEPSANLANAADGPFGAAPLLGGFACMVYYFLKKMEQTSAAMLVAWMRRGHRYLFAPVSALYLFGCGVQVVTADPLETQLIGNVGQNCSALVADWGNGCLMRLNKLIVIGGFDGITDRGNGGSEIPYAVGFGAGCGVISSFVVAAALAGSSKAVVENRTNAHTNQSNQKFFGQWFQRAAAFLCGIVIGWFGYSWLTLPPNDPSSATRRSGATPATATLSPG